MDSQEKSNRKVKDMIDEYSGTFELDYPIKDEIWDLLTDNELEHTNTMIFTTKSGRQVEFRKVAVTYPPKRG